LFLCRAEKEKKILKKTKLKIKRTRRKESYSLIISPFSLITISITKKRGENNVKLE
jgi:hypothetical protein